MEKDKKNNEEEELTVKNSKNKFSRREILKGLATIPVFGLFIEEFIRKQVFTLNKKNKILQDLDLGIGKPDVVKSIQAEPIGQRIRVGIIGYGNRAQSLTRSLGYGHPEWIKNQKSANSGDYKDRMNQENLNTIITGICEVNDMRAENGLETAQNAFRPEYIPGTLPEVKRYRTYQEMLASDEIDAVIISTPDHQHARMTIDAANAGKHVYCEKCMTCTEEEAHQVKEAVERNKIVFQLGHQFSQGSSFFQAKKIIQKNILGKITLVETSTNRNTPHGAWVRHVDENGKPKPGSLKNIDWKQWLGDRPEVPFSLIRYYNWPTYFDYSTGLVGELFSHEYDAVNQLLDLGMPKSVVGSGGIYYFKDGRETPDVFHGVFEYPDRELTVTYSASLANSRSRPKLIMGHDASMELGRDIVVLADQNSTRYKQKIEQGIIDPSRSFFNYRPGSNEVDAITSATEQYYATRGLMNTYNNGKRVNIAHLHVKEWLNVIRNGGRLSCGIQKAYEVTITCHMATKSYLEKRRVEWDPVNNRIV